MLVSRELPSYFSYFLIHLCQVKRASLHQYVKEALEALNCILQVEPGRREWWFSSGLT